MTRPPILVAGIGNHEVDGGYNKPRAKAPFFYALFDGLYPETGYATLDFGDYLSLVLLDTAHTSAIEGAQTDWLAKALKERAERPHVVVVNHVPAYPSFRKMEGKDGKAGRFQRSRRQDTVVVDCVGQGDDGSRLPRGVEGDGAEGVAKQFAQQGVLETTCFRIGVVKCFHDSDDIKHSMLPPPSSTALRYSRG